MDFNLDRLRTFMVVARNGNLSAAAKELGATQPNLGRQMAALSKELGIDLLERHTRGYTLTEKGREYFALCEDIVGQLEQRTNLIKEKDKQVQGVLKIAAGTGGSERILDKLHILRSKFPQLRYKISSTADIFKFKIGDADVGIFPIFSPEPDLIQQHLYDMELRIYAAPSYLKTHGTPKNLNDLHKHQIIIYSGENPETTEALNIHLTKDHIKNRKFDDKIFIDVNNGVSLRKALINGLGIGTFWYDKDILDQQLLVDVFPEMPSRVIPYYYTYHRRLENSPKVENFYEFLNEIYSPLRKSGR
jgi:DNA-binding transcriptional LysR family regulator